MIYCQHCGQVNSEGVNFCRFCGTKFVEGRIIQSSGFEYSPPRPYMWKTDEFQSGEAQSKPANKTINRVQPLEDLSRAQEPDLRTRQLERRHTSPPEIYGYRCPRCGSQAMPKVVRKISPGGWIVFAVLLVTFFPLFWIGLLIKEDARICPVCDLKLS